MGLAMKLELPIQQALSAAIEVAINQLIKHAGNGEDLLSSLDGKLCIVFVQEFQQAILLRVAKDKVLVNADVQGIYQQNPDDTSEHSLHEDECWVSVSIFAIDKLKQNSQLTKLIKTGQLDFAGDLSILQSLSRVINELDLDIEEILSQYVGDIAAYQINKGGQNCQAFMQAQIASIKLSLADAALDEKPIAVRKIMLINFSDELNLLQSAVERAEARLARLEKVRQIKSEYSK